MANRIEDPDPDEEGKKATVALNTDHWSRIRKEMRRLEKQNGYPATVSYVVRKLVEDGLAK